MLLGVAQVVVNVADLEPRTRELKAAGFDLSFAERDIPNHAAKRALQARPRERLDMVHLTAPAGGVAVEVTAYAGGPPAGRAPYDLELPAGASGRARVFVRAADTDASRRFWRDELGFREAGDGELTFAAIRSEWALDVTLRQAVDDGDTSVDADGCVLVTMLSTGLEADAARLAGGSLVLRSTPAWEESIHGRLLRVAMVEGPSGELIELIELPRQS